MMKTDSANALIKLTIVSVLIAALSMAFVIQKLVNAGMLIVFLYSAYWISRNTNKEKQWFQSGEEKLLLFVFSFPFLLSLVLSVFKGNFDVDLLDENLRILIVLPIYLFLVTNSSLIKFGLFERAFAFGFFALCILYLSGYGLEKWGYDTPRASTYFVDANTMGLIALIGFYFSAYKTFKSLPVKEFKTALYYLIGTCAALYLLFSAQTRMAWLAALFMLPLAALFTKHRLALFVAVSVAVGFAAANSSIVQNRFMAAQSELSDYFSGKPVDLTSSLGQRLSFYKAAVILASDKPVLGYTPQELQDAIRSEPARLGLNDQTKESLLGHGVHNQYFEKLMLNGALGFLASLALYLVPCYYFFQCLRQRRGGVHESAAFLGVVLCLSYFFTGLSMVLTLKYINSFYAGMVVLLYATLRQSGASEKFH